jgi:protein PhnA
MTQQNPACPKCNSAHAYPDGSGFTCPECFHEWAPKESDEVDSDESGENESSAKFLDVNGVQLENGDSVTTTKDLQLGKSTLKSGTKVKNIRLLDIPVNEHDISCKVDGHGSIYLKCSVVKKVK